MSISQATHIEWPAMLTNIIVLHGLHTIFFVYFLILCNYICGLVYVKIQYFSLSYLYIIHLLYLSVELSPIFLGSKYTSFLYRPSGALNSSMRAKA